MMRRLGSLLARRPPGVTAARCSLSGGSGAEGVPRRTVPEEALCFTARGYFASDTYKRYPNALGVHPAQCSISMTVRGSSLGLTSEELEALKIMVGPRWNGRKGELKLTCRLFPSRVENKKYLTFQLENLLQEARSHALSRR